MFQFGKYFKSGPLGIKFFFTLACPQQKELSLTLSGYKEQFPRPSHSTP